MCQHTLLTLTQLDHRHHQYRNHYHQHKKHHHHQQHVPTVLAQHTLLTLLSQLDHRHKKYIIVNMTLSDSTIYIILHSTNFNPCEQTSWPCNENWEIG